MSALQRCFIIKVAIVQDLNSCLSVEQAAPTFILLACLFACLHACLQDALTGP